MFKKAIGIASRFTFPVVISSRTVKGKCHAMMGACIAVNPEGWILTAAHIIHQIQAKQKQVQLYQDYQRDLAKYERETSTATPHKKGKLHHLTKPGSTTARNHSVWWGVDGVQMVEVVIAPANDLALCRLEPFDADRIQEFPVFKDPAEDYVPGQSLCRIGYSFFDIVPQFDEERNAFLLPEGAVPPPLFAIDGMFARILNAPAPGGPKDQMGKFIETTSPGLLGQSGGPIFDPEGRVWALQSHTRHYALGFKPPTPGPVQGQVEHQFLNVGAGVHAEAILALLDQQGVKHQRSSSS